MLRVTRPVIASALLLALVACKRERSGYAGGTIDTTQLPVSSESLPIAAAPGYMSTTWSGPVIIGFATMANDGEIQLAMLGEKKATDSRVKAYARQMLAAHKEMKADAEKMAKGLKEGIDTTAKATKELAEHLNNKIKELTEKPAGKEWDEEYMEVMVEGHENVLKRLQEALEKANTTELRAALDTTIAKVKTHLSQARDLPDKID